MIKSSYYIIPYRIKYLQAYKKLQNKTKKSIGLFLY